MRRKQTMDEFRINNEPLEIRMDESGVEIIEGYAITFETRSGNLGGFTETIATGALAETRLEDIAVTFNHNPDNIVARFPGSASYTVDRRGLKISFEPADTTVGKDLKTLVKRGDIKGMSFTFRIAQGGEKWDKPAKAGGLYHRTVTAIEVVPELGPVTFPAYGSTNVEVAKRSLGMFKDKIEKEETDALELEKQKEEARMVNYHRRLKQKIKQRKIKKI